MNGISSRPLEHKEQNISAVDSFSIGIEGIRQCSFHIENKTECFRTYVCTPIKRALIWRNFILIVILSIS